jgi:uncharacterized protein YihD (DUF1040 family)
MRDPARIAGMIELLEEIWRKEPDLRLSQLVTIGAVKGGWQNGADIFSAEDDVVEAGLRAYRQMLKTGG